MTESQTVFTLHDICKIMYKAGAHETLIAAELCGLVSLSGDFLSYDKLQSIMTKAKEEVYG